MTGHTKTILLFLFLLAAAAVVWISYRREIRQYHSGNLIQLIDLLPDAQANKEALTKDWTRVVALNKQTDIWKTHSRFAILTSTTPRLFGDDREFVAVKDIFQADITPGHWSWNGEDIWVALQSGESPIRAHFILQYQTRELRLVSQREALEKPQNLAPMSSSSRAIFLYQTKQHTVPCNHNEGISLHDGGNEMHGPPNLLDDQSVMNGWTQLNGAHYTLLDAPANKRITLERSGNVYKNSRFYTSGFVRFTFVAAARAAGKARLLVGVQLDDRKVGLLRIVDGRFASYWLQTYVRAGHHTLTAGFVTPPARPTRQVVQSSEQHDEPDISLSHVHVDYIDAIVVAARPEVQAKHRYTVQYCTPEDRVVPENVTVHGDARAAFVLNPSSRTIFRLKLPQQARLTFGLSYLAPPSSDRYSTRLVIRVKPFLSSHRKEFSIVSPPQEVWSDQTVDLSAYSGKRVSLEFEAFPPALPLQWAPRIAIANPLIFSQTILVKKQPPDIFIITADALRADHLGCYGYGRPTSPNIDLFSKDAVLFENAISQGAGTLPSTSSLFTSVYPSMHKADYGSKLSSEFFTLPEIARSQQYITAGFVQNEYLSPSHGLSDGFLWYRYDTFPLKTEGRLQNALTWIQNMQHFPLFVFFHMLHPHSPYVPPQEFAEIFNVSQMPLASSNEKLIEVNANHTPLSNKEREQLISLYDAEIRHLDAMFGDFIQQLKRLHLYDDALIVFLSDHGEGFQEHGMLLHGSSVYQNLIHVPLIVKFPAALKAQGIRISDYVQTMDLAPTILQLSQLAPPRYMQGRSLLRFLPRSPKSATPVPVFSEVLSGKILCEIKDGYKYVYMGRSGKEELYDLKSDPGETKDLSAERSDLMKTFRNERTAFILKAAQWQQKYGLAQEEKLQLDEHQKEQLRALGYVH